MLTHSMIGAVFAKGDELGLLVSERIPIRTLKDNDHLHPG